MFLTPENTSWAQALKYCYHDFYHLPAYVSLEAGWHNAKPLAFRYDSGGNTMLLPLLVRPTPAGTGVDAVTPYGYSPPVCTYGASEQFLVEGLSAYQRAAIDKGHVTTFMRLHPIVCEKLPLRESFANGKWTQTDRGFTVNMPLDQDYDSWLASLNKGQRYDIRRLHREGCRFLMNTDEAWDSFPDIYTKNMERIGASDHYLYSVKYLEELQARLDGNIYCCAVADSNGEVMCAALFTSVSGILQYHLSGTKLKFSKLAPTKLLLTKMREWAKENQIEHFHLGGGFGSGEDTLYNFKKRFGGDRLTFRTVSVIHDQEAFTRECEAYYKKNSEPVNNDFFPPYRAPTGPDG